MDIQNRAGQSQVNVDSGGKLNVQRGAAFLTDPSPSTGGVQIKAAHGGTTDLLSFVNASNAQVARVDTAGIGTFGDINVSNAGTYNKVTDKTNIAWTTGNGLHLPSWGNAQMVYIYKIVAGVLHFHMNITFG